MSFVLPLLVALHLQASAAGKAVSHVVLSPDVPVRTVGLSQILPQPLAGLSSTLSPLAESRLRSAVADMGMQWNSVLVLGTEKQVIVLPRSMVGVADRVSAVRVPLGKAGSRKAPAPARIHLESAGLSRLEDYVNNGDYQGAYEALNRAFDLNRSRSGSVPVVDSLPPPDASRTKATGKSGSRRGSTAGGRLSVRSMERLGAKAKAGSVLYSEGGRALVRGPKATQADFKNLYVVKTPLAASEFSAYGKIVSQAPGEFVVMRVKPGSVPGLLAKLSEKGHMGGLIKLNGHPARPSAGMLESPQIPTDHAEPAVMEAQQKIDASKIHATVDTLADLLTRYHDSETGKGVAALLAQQYEKFRNGRSDVSIQLFPHSDTPQPSLIVRILGQKKPDEIVVLGSHIDSINHEDVAARAPGADDNASGTATNLEIFRVMMERGIRPERTIEIHGYAAEEIGLVGSQEIAQKYARDGKKVVSMMQLDMDLYKKPGSPDKIWFVTNESDPGLVQALNDLMKAYKISEYGADSLRGGSSDQESWMQNGVPAVLPTEYPRGYNPDIHTPNDTTESNPDKEITFDQGAKFGKLALAYLAHFAGIAPAPPALPAAVPASIASLPLNPD